MSFGLMSGCSSLQLFQASTPCRRIFRCSGLAIDLIPVGRNAETATGGAYFLPPFSNPRSITLVGYRRADPILLISAITVPCLCVLALRAQDIAGRARRKQSRGRPRLGRVFTTWLRRYPAKCRLVAFNSGVVVDAVREHGVVCSAHFFPPFFLPAVLRGSAMFAIF